MIHAYQKYDPAQFPPPSQPPPDLVSPAFEQALMYGNYRELTEEELARAVRLDPSQIAGLGPSLDMLRAMLEERKRKILETYETQTSPEEGPLGISTSVPRNCGCRGRWNRFIAVRSRRNSRFSWSICGIEPETITGHSHEDCCRSAQRMSDKHQIEELASKYEFTGNESMTVPKALEVKEELEKIDELLKQLEEAAKTAQIGIIDMEMLSEFAEPGDMNQLEEMRRQVENLLREQAERQGLERNGRGRRRFSTDPQGLQDLSRHVCSNGFSVNSFLPRVVGTKAT